jgi:DNA (cytosine-5)-methyltransferase 1
MLKKYDDIINDLDKLDYKTTYMKLNSSHFGIPQNRRRIFFVALNRKSITKRKQKFKIFHETVKDQENSKSVLLREAISDLPPLVAHRKNYDTSFNNNISGRSLIIHDISNASEYVKKINYNRSLGALFNHKARYNNPRDVEIFGLLKEGDNSLSKSIQNLNPYKNRNNIFIDKYFKLKYDDICKTITAHMRYDCNMYIHPEQARGLTAREAARVQSFPDNYVFLGNFQRTYQQIGNAVPPKLASVLGNAIKEIL